MRRFVPLLIWAASLTLGVGCQTQGAQLRPLADGGIDGGLDAGVDIGPVDAGHDGGAPDSGVDSGFVPDGGILDSGMSDAGIPDAGAPDGGLPDAGPGLSFPDAGPPLTDAGSYEDLLSGDLNGDGILDLVAGWFQGTVCGYASWGTSGFDVFYGLADGGLLGPTHYDGGADGLSFAIADLNGDGVADLVASNVLSVSVYLGLVDGGFAAPVAYRLPPSGVDAGCVLSVGVGDLSGTGRMDLVVSSADWGYHFYAFANSGNGGFSSAIEMVPPNSALGAQLIVLDLNHDGLADVVGIGGTSGLSILLNEGDGGFAQASTIRGENFPGPVSDGAEPMALLPRAGGGMDLALSTYSDPEDWHVLVLSNQGDGTFADGGQFALDEVDAVGLYPGFAASADIDGDGVYDLAFSGSVNGRYMQVLYGTDAGGFGTPRIFAKKGRCGGGIAPLGSVAAPHAVAIADLCGGGITVLGDASKH